MNQSNPNNRHKTLNDEDLKLVHQLTRRDFIKCSAGAVGLINLGILNTGCAVIRRDTPARYAIDSKVMTTAERVLSFTVPARISIPNSGVGLCPTELSLVSEYSKYGYGSYTYGGALPVKQRFDIMPSGYNNSSLVRPTTN